MATTDDALLGGRVALRQPRDGYRAAIDPVLLAAAVPAKAGQTVLDVGCGVGAAALCLMARCPDVAVTGLELQPKMAALARENAAANGAEGRFEVLTGDVLAPPAEMAETFDHVMANPPYAAVQTGNAPPDKVKATAHVEGTATLADWVGFCAGRVRRKGSVTFIHRADRIDALIAALHAQKGERQMGDVTIIPLWPGSGGQDAKRVIVRARRGVASPARLTAGLVLHGEDGTFTEAASCFLNSGDAIAI